MKKLLSLALLLSVSLLVAGCDSDPPKKTKKKNGKASSVMTEPAHLAANTGNLFPA